MKEHANLLGLFLLTLLFAGCVIQPTKEEKPVDIYAPIKNNVIEYRNDEEAEPIVQAGSDYMDSQIKQVRYMFFSQNYDQASQLAERLIRQAPNNPDTYYWLARIRMEMSDYQQATQMAQKGISVSQKGTQVRKALQRLQQQASIAIE